ncbi:MAG: site-2 protease family protein [Pseudomonadota bacterium]
MIDSIQSFIILAPSILLAVTVHEFAHGWVADRLGDNTARLQGRLTLNPLKHLDLVGTIVFFLTHMIGWAKPVPVNPYNFRNPRKGMLWVALAGPVSNLLFAVCCAILHYALGCVSGMSFLGEHRFLSLVTEPLYIMSSVAVRINVGLAVFNVIPVPPLDGSKILAGVLPASLAAGYARIERFGFLILILLLISGVVDTLVFPVIHILTDVLLHQGVTVC